MFGVVSLSAKIVPVEPYYIPEPAQILLVSHFKDPVIAKATLNTRNKVYHVTLTDGKDFSFDYFGEWLGIDCNNEAIPLQLVPRPVRSKVATSYGSDAKVVKMTKHNKYNQFIHVKLNNGVELSVEF